MGARGHPGKNSTRNHILILYANNTISIQLLYDEDDAMSDLTGNAFIKKKKGSCYLTIKIRGRNAALKKVRQYKIEAQEKRDLRRRYPNVTFDWKKITAQ